jgi:exoribonuclease-2
MEPGCIVEYIDRKKIVCAVVLESKNLKLRLLNEANREIKMSASRLAHRSNERLDLSLGRDQLTESLKAAAVRRKTLSDRVDIRELWEVVNEEQEWIDLETMTAFCFPNEPTNDHESAVLRAFFEDHLYFKFSTDRFFPYTPEQVDRIRRQLEEEDRRKRIVEKGAEWVKAVTAGREVSPPANRDQYIGILKSMHLFEKESVHYELGKAILDAAGVDMNMGVFQFLVKLGVWDADENLDLIRWDVPQSFPAEVTRNVETLPEALFGPTGGVNRRDLRDFPLITIDGQMTLDYDDALSVEKKGDNVVVGVHIADVGEVVKKDDPIDREAMRRGSSIYMPDQKIPMLPPSLAEDLCSLRAETDRPAISILAEVDPEGKVLGSSVFPSLIRIRHQLSYHEANSAIEEDPSLSLLLKTAARYRKRRLGEGAVQITLPEVNVWFDGDGSLVVGKTNRESPARMLVSEIMILANSVMARFLADQNIPAVFRSQPEPKERIPMENGGTIFQNWMQRRLLNRFILGHAPEPHSGLGVDAYVTATSPIRKAFDLITQRQIRSAFGFPDAYTVDEIDHAIALLEEPMSHVGRIQFNRRRYWLLKYLEGRVGEKAEAIVLDRRKSRYTALMTDYMIECSIPLSAAVNLKPEDVIRLTIQHVDARRDQLIVYVG